MRARPALMAVFMNGVTAFAELGLNGFRDRFRLDELLDRIGLLDLDLFRFGFDRSELSPGPSYRSLKHLGLALRRCMFALLLLRGLVPFAAPAAVVRAGVGRARIAFAFR